MYDHRSRIATPEDRVIATEERYRLGSLGDLIDLIVDGWQVDRLHYAEDSALDDSHGSVPAAFIELTRADQGRYGIYIPDDGKAFSHRALISLFRECPHIWKHRSADRIHQMAQDSPMADPIEQDHWSEVVEPFPGAVIFSPGTLRGVVAIDQTDSVGEVTVSLTVLERYHDGARLRFMIQTGESRRRKHLNLVGLEITDDLGRSYRTAILEASRDGNRVEGAMALGPAIPRDASNLTVRIAGVGDARKADEAAQGPWSFPIQLAQAVPQPV